MKHMNELNNMVEKLRQIKQETCFYSIEANIYGVRFQGNLEKYNENNWISLSKFRFIYKCNHGNYYIEYSNRANTMRIVLVTDNPKILPEQIKKEIAREYGIQS